MSKKTPLKLLSTTAAVLTCCNVLYSTGISFPRAAAAATATETKSSEPVSVIIQITGNAVLDGADSPDYLQTDQAAAETARAERAQAQAQQMQQAQQADALNTLGDAYQKFSKAPEGGSATEALMGGR